MSKYFSPNEPGLDGGRYEKLKPELLNKLDDLREILGKAVIITSSYRGPDHPIESAKPNGPGVHSTGSAVDCAVIGGGETFLFVKAAIEAGFKRIGINRNRNFVHIDIADKASSIWTYNN